MLKTRLSNSRLGRNVLQNWLNFTTVVTIVSFAVNADGTVAVLIERRNFNILYLTLIVYFWQFLTFLLQLFIFLFAQWSLWSSYSFWSSFCVHKSNFSDTLPFCFLCLNFRLLSSSLKWFFRDRWTSIWCLSLWNIFDQWLIIAFRLISGKWCFLLRWFLHSRW